MPDLHTLISTFSYLAIFVLMLSNGVLSFPSSQLLYIICGYFVSTGHLLLIPTIIVGAIANTIGNSILFLLVKKYQHPLARKVLMMDEHSFTKIHTALHATFSHRGMWWIFFGKLTPSIKVFVPIVAALADTSTRLTACVFFVASLIWASALTSLGYFFGEHITLSNFAGVSLLIGGTIMFFAYKHVATQLKKKA